MSRPAIWLAAAVGAGGSRVLVRGYIDRVDLTAAGPLLIDYKRTVTRHHNLPAKPSAAQVNWQLPLYAVAAEQQLGQPVQGWAFIGYRRPATPQGAELPPERIGELVAQVSGEVVEAVGRLRAGEFQPTRGTPPDARRDGGRWRALARLADAGQEVADE